jgi:energy-coupling factor transporter transmembrane protein EcfT
MDKFQRYRFNCTLTFGDIYGQVIAWLVVLLISLAAAMGLMGARQPLYALVSVGLVLVLSLPFLLFAFVTTLVNHIEFVTVDPQAQTTSSTASTVSQQPAQAAG